METSIHTLKESHVLAYIIANQGHESIQVKQPRFGKENIAQAWNVIRPLPLEADTTILLLGSHSL